MSYIDIVLTTDKRFYIAPAWKVHSGDMVAVTNQCGERVLKTVEEVVTEEYGGEVMALLEKYAGCPLKRIEEKYSRHEVKWPDEKEAEDVHE